jgi:hypothetical protein
MTGLAYWRKGVLLLQIRLVYRSTSLVSNFTSQQLLRVLLLVQLTCSANVNWPRLASIS